MLPRNAVALVTGGSSGLGSATVARLLQSGCKGVISVDLNAPKTAASDAGVLRIAGDVSSEADVKRALDEGISKFGEAPRVVVNCAGIAPSVRVLSKRGVHPLDVFERTLRVNVVGTFNVLRLASERMASLAPIEGNKSGARGVIINTASVAAFDGQIGQAAYSASKGAIAGMCLPLARDLAQQGIRVVTIAPGVFKTPMVAGFPQEVQDALAKEVPFPKRLGDPDEYARFVIALCETEMMNGETIRLDGALRMAPR